MPWTSLDMHKNYKHLGKRGDDMLCLLFHMLTAEQMPAEHSSYEKAWCSLSLVFLMTFFWVCQLTEWEE